MANKNKTRSSRNGKHRKDKTKIGLYIEKQKKAIAVICAKELGCSLSDLLWSGVERLAIEQGIITQDGIVTEKFSSQVEVAREIIEQVNLGD